MRRVAAIVTDKGGRTGARGDRLARVRPAVHRRHRATATAHAARWRRGDGVLRRGRRRARLRRRACRSTIDRVDASHVPQTRTQGHADRRRSRAARSRCRAIPNAGVGLARTEFIVTNHIGIHPMALARYPQLKDPQAVEARSRRGSGRKTPRDVLRPPLQRGRRAHRRRVLSEAGHRPHERLQDQRIRAAPRRREFEPAEENPMIGFRGASRYYDARYADGFALECAALLRARATSWA